MHAWPLPPQNCICHGRAGWGPSQLTHVAATVATVFSTQDLAAPGSDQAAADPRGTTWAAFGPQWKYSDVNSDAPNPRLGGTAGPRPGSRQIPRLLGTPRSKGVGSGLSCFPGLRSPKLQPQPQQVAPPGPGPKGLPQVAGRRRPHTTGARLPRPAGPARRIWTFRSPGTAHLVQGFSLAAPWVLATFPR